MTTTCDRLRKNLPVIALGIALAIPSFTHAATFTVVNLDSPGEGFNDTTPATPVGGNSGTTIGAQRLIAFQHAANIWGARLQSNVPIRVAAQFDPLSCNANSGVLGQAGFNTVHRNFTGAPLANVWYPAPLANALFGSDLDPASNDLRATFSSNLGSPGCLETSGWYYGLDASGPGNLFDFATVLLHELGHGVGFASLTNLSTGAKFNGGDDAYSRLLEHHGATPPDFPSMSDVQRFNASRATGNLHWTGRHLRASSVVLTAGRVDDHVRLFAPNPAQGGSSVSHFDTALTPNQLMEPFYTAPLHDPGLALPLFQDLEWNVIGAPTCSLSANPASIVAGQSSTVSWSSTGATGGSIAPAIGSVGPTGSQSVTPATTTTYEGVFIGARGSEFCSTTVTVNPGATIAVSASPAGAGTVTGGGTFPTGTSRTVVASPNPGFRFVNWTEGGTEVSTNASFTFTLNANRTLVANFAANPVNRTIAVSAAPPAGGTVTGGGTFPQGSSRTVTATPNAGFRFVNWTEGGNPVSTSASFTFTLNANRTLVANFVRVQFRVTVSAAPPAGGTVTGGGTFASNTSRTVVATPKPSFSFLSWLEAGNQVSATPRFTFTLTKNRTLVARFIPTHVPANDLLADLGTAGLWQFLNNTTWRRINPASPTAIGAGDLNGNGKDEALYVLPDGLFARLDNGSVVKLDPRRPKLIATGDLDNSGRDEVIVDFGSSGVFARFNNTGSFVSLRANVPQLLATGDLDGNKRDEVLAAFPNGLWVRADTGVWSRLDARRPLKLATGNLDNNLRDEVFAVFPGAGVFVRSNNAGAFTRLDPRGAQAIAVGDFNGNGRDELLAVFSTGLSLRRENGQWTVLDARRPLNILAVDLDGNGKDEIVADFAGQGLFARYNNGVSWVRLRPEVSQGLARGGFN